MCLKCTTLMISHPYLLIIKVVHFKHIFLSQSPWILRIQMSYPVSVNYLSSRRTLNFNNWSVEYFKNNFTTLWKNKVNFSIYLQISHFTSSDSFCLIGSHSISVDEISCMWKKWWKFVNAADFETVIFGINRIFSKCVFHNPAIS